MGCCCGKSDEDDIDEKSNPGPDIQRRCTDPCCLATMIAVMLAFLYFLIYLRNVSNLDILRHGHDHYRNICGRGTQKDRRTVYYPDLSTDLLKDSTLRKHYGVCTNGCPEQGTVLVEEYGGETPPGEKKRGEGEWFVSLPSFEFLGRCIPYDPAPNITDFTRMCAYPQCDDEFRNTATINKEPTKPTQVCGLRRDGTYKYWLLSEPDINVKEAWRTELQEAGMEEDDIQKIIDSRIQIQRETTQEQKNKCTVEVERGVSLRVKTKTHELFLKVLTKYTGYIFQAGKAAYDNAFTILGLGLLASLVVSFALIVVLACFARLILMVLLLLFFTVLSIIDYILFIQAGIVEGKLGKYYVEFVEVSAKIDIPDGFEALLEQSTDTKSFVTSYKWGGIVLAVVIFLLICLLCAMWRKFEIVIALLQEASRTMREMPSLLLFPLVGYSSVIMCGLLFMMIFLGVATLDETQADPIYRVWMTCFSPMLKTLDLEGSDPFKQMQLALVWITIFGLLWAYFFHVACFISVIAMAISHWYFYRDDPQKSAGTGIHSGGWFFGRPVLMAMGRVARYHSGTMAVGSFIMALVTMPRLILEYIAQQTDAESNQVTKYILWAVRCCLYCFEQCVKFLTEYAYVYTAVTGRPFCGAAMSSFKLIAEYPVQVALDKLACWVMRIITCTVVPGFMMIVSYVLIPPQGFLPCATIIGFLSYVTTRLTVGLYDVIVTTLFVCAMRDKEHFGGKYMHYALRKACGFPETDEDAKKGTRQTIEMRPSHRQPTHSPLPPQFSIND